MDHVTVFLGAYLDGELKASQVANIEKHMETCEMCRHELEKHTALSDLLRDTVSMPFMKSDNQFVAEVGLLLAPKPQMSAMKRVLTTGWKAIPVGLAATWVFVQTSLIVMTFVNIIALVDRGTAGIDRILTAPPAPAWSNTLGWSIQPLTMQILEFAAQFLHLDVQIFWQIFVILGVPFVFGLLFVCWLASWWVVKERSIAEVSA